jgi:hypothetical protein
VNEHALAVPFPDVAPPIEGLPAHVTLLIPCPPLVDEIREALSPFSAFDVVFAELRSFPDSLYLAPEPAERFIAIVEALAERFPDWPPYGGAYDTIVPHLTIESAAQVVAPLPVHVRAREAILLEHLDGERWEPVASFPFGGA